MNSDSPTLRRQVEIINALGLHLRPAAKFVKTADRFRSEIRVHFKGQVFDGRSILALATIAAERGSKLELEAAGPDAADALDALAELIRDEFHEDEFGQERPPAPARNGPPPETPPPTEAAS